MTPYVEKIVGDYLRSNDDVAALTSRVRGTPPGEKERSEAWVQVTLLNEPQEPGAIADRLVACYLQFDCYAGATGGQPEASLLSRTVRAALHGLPGTYDEGEVTAVRISGRSYIPDPDIEPQRERYIVTATIWAH